MTVEERVAHLGAQLDTMNASIGAMTSIVEALARADEARVARADVEAELEATHAEHRAEAMAAVRASVTAAAEQGTLAKSAAQEARNAAEQNTRTLKLAGGISLPVLLLFLGQLVALVFGLITP